MKDKNSKRVTFRFTKNKIFITSNENKEKQVDFDRNSQHGIILESVWNNQNKPVRQELLWLAMTNGQALPKINKTNQLKIIKLLGIEWPNKKLK